MTLTVHLMFYTVGYYGTVLQIVASRMKLGVVKLDGCRCGHEWLPHIKNETPCVCPKCKSANWDRPKKAVSND